MGAKGRAKAVATGKKGAKAGKSEGGDGDTALPAPAMGKDRGKKGKVPRHACMLECVADRRIHR
eukprot:161704-Chlamydomonas_euryale.AAC.4